MTHTSLCTPKSKDFGAEISTLRTPIRPSPPSPVCQNGELGSVRLVPRASPKPCGTGARFDTRCVRLATATHRQFTSTQTRRRISLRSRNLRLSSNGGAMRFTTPSAHFGLVQTRVINASVLFSNRLTFTKPLTPLSHHRLEQGPTLLLKRAQARSTTPKTSHRTTP